MKNGVAGGMGLGIQTLWMTLVFGNSFRFTYLPVYSGKSTRSSLQKVCVNAISCYEARTHHPTKQSFACCGSDVEQSIICFRVTDAYLFFWIVTRTIRRHCIYVALICRLCFLANLAYMNSYCSLENGYMLQRRLAQKLTKLVRHFCNLISVLNKPPKII